MNNEELERIYNEAYGPVYWTAYQLLKNEADSEDIVQETFVSLIESYDTIKDKTKVTAWLKKNAANKCLNRLTRSKTDSVEDEFFEDVEAMPEDFLPDTIVESEESRKVIMDIIGSALSDDVRRTLVLYYFDEMTTKEIAEAQGIPQGTVLWRLNFAKKKIKKEVEKYEAKTDSKLYTMALPFLSKLFIAEAQQVPLKPIPPTLLDMTASAVKSVASEAAKTAASGAAKKGAGAAAGKIVAIGLGSAVAVGLIGGGIFLVCSHLLGNNPSAEDEVYAFESEAEEVEAVTEETAETVIEISASEYFTDYPLDMDGQKAYVKCPPAVDYYPDIMIFTDANTGNPYTAEMYYNDWKRVLYLFLDDGASIFGPNVVYSVTDTYSNPLEYYEDKIANPDEYDGTYAISEPEYLGNGLIYWEVTYTYESIVSVFAADSADDLEYTYSEFTDYTYILEYQSNEDTIITISLNMFNMGMTENPIDELELLLDFYRTTEDPIIVVPDGTQVEIVGEAPMPEAAIETTVVQASVDDPVTIAVEDIPELEQLKTFINYFPGEGYDCEEYPEWFSIGNMLPDSSMTEIIVDYGLYFPESYTEYSEDPLGIFKNYVGNSYRLDINRLLWVEENILNMTEDNITSFNSGLYNTPDSYSEYYLADDGYIYYRKGSAGSGGNTIISEAMYDGQYYYIKTYLYDDMFYESDADYDPAEGPFYYYTMELKNIDGKDYWTVIRTSDVAPEVFG